jgi:peptidyl-prolyl cis-trans isomerase C
MELPLRQRPAPEPVTVNGVVIPAEAIAAEAQNHPVPKGKPGWAWKQAARALALRELLLQEARALGLAPSPLELSEGRWETEEEAQIRRLLEEAILPAPVDEAELRAIYEAAPERFRGPTLYEAAHILFSAPPDDAPARAAARTKAGEVLEKLLRDPRCFGALAAEHSACSSRTNGGVLGQLASGDTVPEFEAALAALEEGGISLQPVESRYGFHLIRLDARVRGEVLPFATVLPRLRAAQEKARWTRASHAYVARLSAGADITGVALSELPLPRERASA